MQPITEWRDVSAEIFHDEIRPAGRPAVLRGLAADWPLVKKGRQSTDDAGRYLLNFYHGEPVSTMTLPPGEGGRFFYNRDVNGYNFQRETMDLRDVLRVLLKLGARPDAPAIAMQAIPAPEVLPGFEASHPMPLLPGVAAKLWIGSAGVVGAHYDLKENIACVAVGRRRFTLFPPEQLPNLYVGPIDNTPAGSPMSMVSIADPDMAAHPRFAEALGAAEFAELGPGDALYMPYMWWHGVEALDPFNILVNYWWDDHPPRADVHPSTAIIAARLAFMDMPEERRRIWRAFFDHYVFGGADDALAHLPPHARGVLGELGPDQIGFVKKMIGASLVGG